MRARACELTRYAGAELVGKLGDEVIVYSVLHWAQYDHRPRVVDCNGDEDGVRTHLRTHNVPFALCLLCRSQMTHFPVE